MVTLLNDICNPHCQLRCVMYQQDVLYIVRSVTGPALIDLTASLLQELTKQLGKTGKESLSSSCRWLLSNLR